MSLVVSNSTKFCAGTVYDYYFHVADMNWNVWTDSISKEETKIPDEASVCVFQSSIVSKDAKMSTFLRLSISSSGRRSHYPNHGDSASEVFLECLFDK